MSDRYTVEDALHDNQRILREVQGVFGEEDLLKWPVPSKKKRSNFSGPDLKKERQIGRVFRRLGMKVGLMSTITQAQRTLFWNHLDMYYDPSLEDDLKRGVIWCAWCKLIGIPTPDEIESISEMLFSMHVSDGKPREWSTTLLLTVSSGILLCEDYAELAEFLMWFTGTEIEIGWLKYPEFKDPILQDLRGQHNFAEIMDFYAEHTGPRDQKFEACAEALKKFGKTVTVNPMTILSTFVPPTPQH